MEAPEFVRFIRRWGLGLGVVFIVGIFYPLPARDYEISAHAALTNAIIEKYNATYPDAEIDSEFRFDLVRGAKEEDDNSRSLNHFYDPVRNRGLSFSGKSWMRSKSWAVADDVNNFTWGKGLDAYANSDYHRAFLILGHVLHLLEDASVPDHVRNDAHIVDSPYESFTKTLVPLPDAKPPVILADMASYFDIAATYANNGFYSADTINDSAYQKPKPDYIKQEGKYLYGFKADEYGAPYHLVHYVKIQKYLWASLQESKFLNHEENKILSDYWRLLSAHVIRHGAGMVKLFITEGEKLKKEQATNEKNSKSIYATLASVVDVFASTAESVDSYGDGLTEAESIPLEANVIDAPTAQTKASASATKAATKKTPAPKAASVKSKSSTTAAKKVTVKTAPPKACAYAKSVTPTRGPVIVNEVAWMGGTSSASDEWIELKNISDVPAVIGGWQVISKKGSISAVIPAGTTIPTASYYLLERTDDTSVPSITADFIYVGSLANTDDGVRLLDATCKAADDVGGDPAWPAGDAPARRTMERAKDFSWHDYTGSGANGIFGTPRAENSAPPLIKAGSAVGGSSSQAASVGQSVTVAAAPVPQFTRGDVIINDFLFDADGVDAGNEFVEFYNATDEVVRLTGWSIQIKSGALGTIKKMNCDDGLSIPANGCFLAWLGTPPADARPQFIWSSGTLNNTAATIYLSATPNTVQGDSDTNIVDSIAYIKEAIAGFAAGMSAERVGETSAVRARQAPSPNSCVRLADDEPIPSASKVNRAEEKSAAPFTLPTITVTKNPDSSGARISVAWGAYPFIPLINKDEPSWGALAFYLNHEPDGKAYISTADNRQSTGSSYALRMQYPIIRAGSFPWQNVLVLPDTRGNMTTDNGLFSDAYNYDTLMANTSAHVTTDTVIEKGDYITVGYYRFSHAGGGSQNLNLIYADPKKIYFK